MKSTIVVLVFAALLLSGCASKQVATSDPLTGIWSGEWGPSPERQTQVELDLKWDGTHLTGTIDPQRRSLELKKSSFDAKTNAIHMEVDAPMTGGEMDHYTIDGKVDGKSMSGTWTRHNGSGDFKIAKQ